MVESSAVRVVADAGDDAAAETGAVLADRHQAIEPVPVQFEEDAARMIDPPPLPVGVVDVA